VGTRCADHVTPLYPQKLALTSPTGGGRSVGIVRSRTKATEFIWISEYARLFPCTISTDGFCMTDVESVYCAVRNDSLYNITASS